MLKAQKYSEIPGDTRLETTEVRIDTTGQEWPAGTIYTPQSFGFNNTTNRSEQRVIIGKETVTFEV